MSSELRQDRSRALMAGALESRRPITGRRSSPLGGRGRGPQQGVRRLRERGSAFPEPNVSEEEVVWQP